MLIRRRNAHDVRPSEITDEGVYQRRRQLLKAAGLAGIGAATGVGLVGCDGSADARAAEAMGGQLLASAGDSAGANADIAVKFADIRPSRYSTDQEPNSWEDVTTYNNFYEFGTGKGDPVRNAHTLQTDPWSVSVRGQCDKPGTYTLEDILAPHPLEERIYRLRCVEAWSMVVPWVGISMGDVLKRFQPNSRAKYVKFETLVDPEQMPGQRRRVLDWPYVEGLRIDEAMNPLTIFGVGVYGKPMPNQNGAPLRLIVPWKYGFKSIKSIVSIEFTERQPRNSWNVSQPSEYGFYANVNPEVDHPRWSQASERIIGSGLFSVRKPTAMFNGYAEEVASMYAGMDLRRNY